VVSGGPVHRLPDAVEVTAQPRSQDLELRLDLARPGARAAGEQVAGVGVLRDNRSVFFSPPQPTMTGGWGALSGCGEFRVSASR